MTPSNPDEREALAARLMAVPEEEIVRGGLRQAVAVLREVQRSETLSLRLRARAEDALRILEAIESGRVREAQHQLVSAIAESRLAAANERPHWSGAHPARPSGPEGYVHAVRLAGGSFCGLPAEALEMLRNTFSPQRLDSCPTCAALSRSAFDETDESGRPPVPNR